MSLKPTRSFVFRYLMALLAVSFMSAALHLVRHLIDSSTIALMYLVPVGLSTAALGQGPGIVAAVGSFLAFNYFFVPPFYTFEVLHRQNLLALGVFLVVAVVTSRLVAQARSSLEAAMARGREATRLYELSASLVGLNDTQRIAETVAEHLSSTFRAEHVQVGLQADGGAAPLNLQLPAGSPLPDEAPSISVPVQGMRTLLGEISLWRRTPVGVEEERVLRASASLSALALERARLAQAESRAKVLEQSDALKSALLSSVSHELRSPLATIKASVTSLLSQEVAWDTEARQELLTAMEEEADHLNLMVGNLLDMSRLEAGSMQPQRNWNVLAEIVRSVTARMRTAARQHRLTVDVSEDLPLIPVDYIQIEQVFANLISNSIKYSPEGTTIAISARALDDHWLLVQVRNQSPPIPEEHLARIFDKFHRVTAAEQITGTGLGLSICKGIVEAHGGRIWAENAPGGLRFSFTLPLTWKGAGPQVGQDG